MVAGPARRDRGTATRERSEARDVRGAILAATERLLAEQRFDKLSVAAIIDVAQVSRASFYFYFESKNAVLSDLVRQTVERASAAAQPWVAGEIEPPESSLRRGTAQGIQLWREHAPVLRAIVENWRADPRLTELWTEMMDGFTAAATARIERDRLLGRAPVGGVDARTLASTLTWMSERIYYLAAIGHSAFSDEQRVIDVLTDIWLSAIYTGPPAKESSS